MKPVGFPLEQILQISPVPAAGRHSLLDHSLLLVHDLTVNKAQGTHQHADPALNLSIPLLIMSVIIIYGNRQITIISDKSPEFADLSVFRQARFDIFRSVQLSPVSLRYLSSQFLHFLCVMVHLLLCLIDQAQIPCKVLRYVFPENNFICHSSYPPASFFYFNIILKCSQ